MKIINPIDAIRDIVVEQDIDTLFEKKPDPIIDNMIEIKRKELQFLSEKACDHDCTFDLKTHKDKYRKKYLDY